MNTSTPRLVKRCAESTRLRRARSFPHSRHGGPEIGFDSLRNSYAEFRRPFYRAPRTGRANDTFRWHASHVQAIPAHQMAFDQGCLRAKPGSHHRGDQSGGAGSDDDDIVPTVGRGVGPGWRMDVVNELLIEFVHRGHGHGFISMIMHGAVYPHLPSPLQRGGKEDGLASIASFFPCHEFAMKNGNERQQTQERKRQQYGW